MGPPEPSASRHRHRSADIPVRSKPRALHRLTYVLKAIPPSDAAADRNVRAPVAVVARCTRLNLFRHSSIAEAPPSAYFEVMVASVLTEEGTTINVFEELLQTKPPLDGRDPEQRIVFCGISWERY